MLIGSHSVFSKSPGRFLSGTSVSGDRSNFNQSGVNRNKFQTFAKFSSVPNGYSPGYAFTAAQQSGGLATYRTLSASTTQTAASLVSGINNVAALSASCTITNAQLAQIVSLIAAISASGGITNAQLAAITDLVASISATGTITDAQLGAIVSLVASIGATGQFTNAADFSTAEISASISSLTALSPETLSAAVWNASISAFNSSGTMGEKLNDAGSATNPWTEVIESGYTATEVLRILLAVAAGKTNIVDLGGGTATVTFRNQADTKDRVTADMTGSERTTIAIDVT